MNRLFAALPALVLSIPAYAADWAPYQKASFDALLAQGKPVVVHVHADWCPTCRKQLSVFPSVLSEAKGAATVRVNFDTDAGFKSEYKVTGQSTIIVFKGGKEVGRAVGATDPAAIKALVQKAI